MTMKIRVAVKRVVDCNVKVRVRSDNAGVDIGNAWPAFKDSKLIVAINKDPEAPIFSVADHG